MEMEKQSNNRLYADSSFDSKDGRRLVEMHSSCFFFTAKLPKPGPEAKTDPKEKESNRFFGFKKQPKTVPTSVELQPKTVQCL